MMLLCYIYIYIFRSTFIDFGAQIYRLIFSNSCGADLSRNFLKHLRPGFIAEFSACACASGNINAVGNNRCSFDRAGITFSSGSVQTLSFHGISALAESRSFGRGVNCSNSSFKFLPTMKARITPWTQSRIYVHTSFYRCRFHCRFGNGYRCQRTVSNVSRLGFTSK